MRKHREPRPRTRPARLEVPHATWAARGPLVAVLDQRQGLVTLWEKGRRRRYVGDLGHMLWSYYEKLSLLEAERERQSRKALRRLT